MGFLQRFYNDVQEESDISASSLSSFDELTEDELEAHMRVASYGEFQLTDAVRPAYDLRVIPKQGYRHDVYEDPSSKTCVPVLMAAATRRRLFDIFIDLLEPLGPSVDVVLETSHHSESGHQDLYRQQIDMPVLKSILCEFEHLLMHDGCTGVAILNPNAPLEVQFDEHKLLIVYGSPLDAFADILERHAVPRDEGMQFITEAEHVHSSNEEYFAEFEDLRRRLGMDGD